MQAIDIYLTKLGWENENRIVVQIKEKLHNR